MDHPAHAEPIYPADSFAGTAAYYVRYRVPYPGEFLAGLIRNSGATGQGRLLDLACGPGRVALALEPSFREVWAVDLEPEMIDAGRRDASRRGLTNIRWTIGRAEDIEVTPASVELITIGEAFHRLHQRHVAAQALQWLRPGCCLAVLGCYSILSGRGEWQRIVLDRVRRWTSSGSQAGESKGPPKPGSGPEHDGSILREAGFVGVASHPYVEPHDWTIEAILGYLYSTSVSSKAALGGNAEAFEADLKSALLAHDPGGVYREDIQWGYTIARKPA
jgi:SAM-dependent methyltransferase